MCSAKDFLYNSNAFETPTAFTIFWDRTGGDERVISTPPQAAMLASLSSTFDTGCPVLLQCWTSLGTTSGRTMLSLSRQPFGFGSVESDTGLCKYRRHCVERESNEGDDCVESGPPGRVIRRQFPEYCPDIKLYTTEEFPTKNYAKACGIVSYCALPLFERDGTGSKYSCVGVLECFSLENFDFPKHLPAIPHLEGLNLACPTAIEHGCDMTRELLFPFTYDDIKTLLKYVREQHQLPIIQAWLPCMCNEDKLFCDVRVCSENLRNFSEFEKFNGMYGSCFVKNGEGLVGRSYGENKPYFCRDTTQFGLSDYPFLHLTRSSGLAACFVIPLGFVHPNLGSLLLEIFLPPDRNHSNGNSLALFKSLLHTVAEGFSRFDMDVGLKQDEDFFAVSYRDSEFIDYISVRRVAGNGISSSSWEELGELPRTDASNTTVPFYQALAAIPENQMQGQYPHEFYPNYSSGEVLTAMTETHQDAQNRANLNVERQMAMDGMQQSLHAQGTAHSSGGFIATVADSFGNAVTTSAVQDPFTREALERRFGYNMDEVAENLGVGRSTLKRRCRKVGIMRWPYHEKHRVTNIQSNPQLQDPQTSNSGVFVEQGYQGGHMTQ